MATEVNVVICTYNRAELLRLALEALSLQTALHDGSWNVLVVDNNCTDNTREVVASHTGQLPSLRVVGEERQGLTEARQRGFWATSAPWVAFVDDDCVVEPNWMSNVLEFIARKPDVAAFNGHNILELDTQTPKPWVGPLMFAAGNPGVDEEQVVSCLHGAGLVLSRKAVERSGWLDSPKSADRRGQSLLSGGDNELAVRAAAAHGELWFVPQCRLHHRIEAGRLKLGYLVRLNYRLAEAGPLLVSMQYEGSRWYARLGRFIVGQLARAAGLKADSLRPAGSGWRGIVLGLARGVGLATGAFKLATT